MNIFLAVDNDHDRRLSTLYELVRRLPKVNMATLKCIVLHLDKYVERKFYFESMQVKQRLFYHEEGI